MGECDERITNEKSNGQSSKERKKMRERERVNDQPVITNRVLMSSLNGNAIVVLVSLETYHRIGSLQTRHHVRKGRERERRRKKGTLVLPFPFLTYF